MWKNGEKTEGKKVRIKAKSERKQKVREKTRDSTGKRKLKIIR